MRFKKVWLCLQSKPIPVLFKWILIRIVEVNSSELAVDSLLELRKIDRVYADTVMQAQRSAGVKEALVDRHRLPLSIDDQTVELHQVLDGEVPALAHPAALVQLADGETIKNEHQDLDGNSLHDRVVG